MSWPLQAGIMSRMTEYSSFIFDLRLRSIKLCAVFLALFLPAAVVDAVLPVAAPACFFRPPAAALIDLCEPVSCNSRRPREAEAGPSGLIWIIRRDLVGGGGSTKLRLRSFVGGYCCCGDAGERGL